MRSPVTKEMVAFLGRAAGFELTPERCQLLAPQLEWLLSEAEHLAELNLDGEEPISIFRPGVFSSFESDRSWPLPGEQKAQDTLP